MSGARVNLGALEKRLDALEDKSGAGVWLCRTVGEPIPAETKRAAAAAQASGREVNWIEYVIVDPLRGGQ
jgi:hypothetical protein